MEKSVFYHAGCSVCVCAEHDIINLLGSDKVEIVHFGLDKPRIEEAENVRVKSVPTLITPNGNVLRINFGAPLTNVKS